MDVIKTAKELLNSTDWGLLDKYAAQLGLVSAPLLELRCKLQKDLYLAREQMRMPNYKPDPKDKDTPRYTDFDRKTMLEAATAEIQANYELVKGLEELVKERLELIRILLGDDRLHYSQVSL